MSSPSTTSSVVDAVQGPAQGALCRVPGVGSARERVEAGREDGVGMPEALGVDPGRLSARAAAVAGQQGLAAARRSDDGHPPRGRQRRRQAPLRLLASETRGEHAHECSVRAPSFT